MEMTNTCTAEKQTSYLYKARTIIKVLFPIFVTQLALVSTGFFDTVMTGRYGEYDLAGVAFGSNLYFMFFMLFNGIFSGLTPVLAYFRGAKEEQKIRFTVQQGMYWALLLAAVYVAAGFLAVPHIIPYFSLEEKVAQVACDYLAVMAIGVFPIFVASVLRNFIDSMSYTGVTMIITVVAVPVNVVLNYIFIYGAFGMPAWGGVGAAIGSAVCFYLTLLLNVLVVKYYGPFKGYRIFHAMPRPDFSEWKRAIKFGTHIGATMFCESSIFGVMALLMAGCGTAVIAAHQSTMSINTMIYMVPLSISLAMTIVIGFEMGAGHPREAVRYGILGRCMSFGITGMIAIIIIFLRPHIAEMFTTSEEIKAILANFLVCATFMQLADSINAPMQGILKGYKDVKVPFYLAVFSYWVIGLPLGLGMAHIGGMGPYGYWVGIVGSLFVGAVMLRIRMWKIQSKINAEYGITSKN